MRRKMVVSVIAALLVSLLLSPSALAVEASKDKIVQLYVYIGDWLGCIHRE